MPAYIPLVALVGRPNVGKSTLFNRMTGRRTALVIDEPGVTRDRLMGLARLGDRCVRVVDTGGIDPHTHDELLVGVRAQTHLAIEAADFVLLVTDAREGVTPSDSEIAALLRRAGKPAAVVANKVDLHSHEGLAGELYALGIDPVLPLSAEHGRGFDDLDDLLVARLNPPTREDSAPAPPLPVSDEELPDDVKSVSAWEGGPIHVAVVGRPNAGKSSLINTLLGEERHLASPQPGTTRDAVDSTLEHAGQPYVFIDTAGVRRKRSVLSKLEQFAVSAAFTSMDRADVVVLVLDGATPPTDQDARIASMAHEKGKGLVIACNKWDLVQNPEWRTQYPKAVRLQFPFAAYAPLVNLSARTGRGLDGLFREILAAQHERHRRVSTGELNRFFREVVNSHPPPVKAGRRPQIYFVSQPLIRPPTFIFASSREDMHFSYVRYLHNALRKRYGFTGTPIWLKFRGRKKKPKDAQSA